MLLIISLNVAAGTAFNVFGGVINGFQRYDLNNVVGAASSVVTAVVNVAVLAAGYGLIELVAATTLVRIVTYLVYRANAYRVFPGLRIRASSFRRERLREVTLFSVYMLLIDCANKMNYSVDALVIGAFLNTSAVAVWTVGQRVAEVTQRLTNQLNDVLFPTVVDNSAAARMDRLQAIFIQGTRLSLGDRDPDRRRDDADGRAAGARLGRTRVLRQRPRAAAAVARRHRPRRQRHGRHGAQGRRRAPARRLHQRRRRRRQPRAQHRAREAARPAPASRSGRSIPVCLASTLVLFPAGCRRVRAAALARAASRRSGRRVWPAAVMTAFVLATRDLVPAHARRVGAEMAVACAVYAAVFVFFGISAAQRHLYLSKVDGARSGGGAARRSDLGGRVRAVILAAGRGDRLRDVTGDRPKCLAPIGGCTLLERQIRSLRACGIETITVVAGFRADDVRRACGPDDRSRRQHAATSPPTACTRCGWPAIC